VNHAFRARANGRKDLK